MNGIDNHFAGKDASVRAIYERLLAVVREIGPIVEEVKKTSIHLVRSTALAGVETRSNYLLLNLKSDHPLSGPLIVVKSEQLSARRYHTKLRFSSPTDIDSTVIDWLEHAYDISG